MKALLFNIQKFSLHDGRGIRTILFFQGCNLRCEWCSNPESQPTLPAGDARYYTIEEIMETVLKDKPFYDKSEGSVTFSGGEPLLQAEAVYALCDELHAEGINVGIETAASVPEEIFSRALEKCDFFIIDLKHWDEKKHVQCTGMDNRLILRNARNALAGDKPVTMRIPLIPGYNDSVEDALKFARLLRNLGAKDVQLLPFHQLGEKKYKDLNIPYAYSGVAPLHDEDLAGFAKVLSSDGLNIQIGG